MTRRRARGEFIETEWGPVHLPELEVRGGQKHPLGFLYDQFNKPEQALKPKPRRKAQHGPIKRRAPGP